jgi:NAD(P)-dependent dehydrogenase (short-subunit alcohol dehydrogenase family)
MVVFNTNTSKLMNGKICIITGANSGIGKATALGLAKMGATIVMVCRNKERGERALNEIKKEISDVSITLMLADLSTQKEIYDFVQDYKTRYQKLNVLVNNAGVNLSKHTMTEDGIETTFAVNTLAPFSLNNLLLDVLKKSTPARIVNVVSNVHAKSIDFDDLYGEKHYHQLKIYSQSKLATILLTYELARRIDGTGVTVNCVHPGYVKTNMVRNFRKFVKYFYHIVGLFLSSPKRGARGSIYLASSPEVEGVNGKFFNKRKEAKTNKASYDEELAQQLWDLCEDLTEGTKKK